MLVLFIVLGVLAVVSLFIFNSLIVKKNAVANVESAIDVMLNMRYDLIPNLVDAVQESMRHERDTLERIVALRQRTAGVKSSTPGVLEAHSELSALLSELSVSIENYPDLKANQNILQLQQSIGDVEEELSAARRAFNAAVTDFNNSLQVIPTNIFAALMGFRKKRLFSAPVAARENVQVRKLFREQ